MNVGAGSLEVDQIEPVAGPSPLQRVLQTFTSPAKAFQNLPASSWWAPYLLLLLFSLGFAAIVGSRVGWETVTHNNLASSSKQQARMDQLPPAQQQAQMAMIARITRTSVYIGSAVFPLIIAAVIAGLLLMSLNFVLGGQARYGPLFALYLFSSLPQVIKLILVYILLFAGGANESFLLNNPLGSNAAFYLQGTDTPKWLLSLLNWTDVFLIWQFVLLIIGCAIIAKVSRGKAAAVVVSWVVLFALIGAGVAAATQ